MMNIPSAVTISFTKTGKIPTSNYNKPLNYEDADPTLNVCPPNMQVVALVRSNTGGNLFYKGNDGIIYHLPMPAGVMIPLSLNVNALASIVNTGADWQGNDASSNDITDLEIYGY